MKTSWITNNIWIKLGALLLAIALWFYVAGEERIEAKLKIPFKFGLAPNIIIARLGAPEIEMHVRGRKDQIAKAESISCDFNLSNYQEAQTLILPVERKNFNLPPEISILKMTPTTLKVEIDRLGEKVVPVRVVSKGDPAPGHSLAGFVIDPVTISVIGPEEYINKLKYIETEPVDITGRRKSFRKMVPLQSIPMIGKEAPAQFVEVIAKIKRRTIEVR